MPLYTSLSRPVSMIGSLPDRYQNNVVKISDVMPGIAREFPFGVVEYNCVIDSETAKHYSLARIIPSHTVSLNSFAAEIADSYYSEYGQEYVEAFIELYDDGEKSHCRLMLSRYFDGVVVEHDHEYDYIVDTVMAQLKLNYSAGDVR